MNKTINEIRENNGLNFEHEFEEIVFNSKRLCELLKSGKNIKRHDRDLLLNTIEIILQVYSLNN